MRQLFTLTAAALLIAGCATQGSLSGTTTMSARPAGQLHQLFAREWTREMRENPITASDHGDRRFNDQWPDLSLDAIRASHSADEAALKDLHAIDRARLSAQDRLNYDLFEWQLKDRLEGYRFHDYLFAINQLGGIQTVGDYGETLRFKTRQDYADWLTRMQSFDTYMQQTIALLQQAVAEKRTLPEVVAKRIPPQIDANIVDDPAESPFYTPFKTMNGIGADEQAALRKQAKQAIEQVIVPAYRRFKTFFVQTYLPNCRDSLAARDLPDGEAYYDYLAHHFTTTDLDAEQIHVIGVEKVNEIRNQMDALIEQTGFKGSFKDFLHYLRTAKRFQIRDPQQLLAAYQAQGKRIDPKLVELFHHLPRIPWGVRPIPADQAPNTYPAYYYPPPGDGSRAGYMYVNLYKPETRPTYEIPVLTCHEAVPGHHFQIALATELEDVPTFRRYAEFTSFTEGWALYSETLCGEVGLYTTPYEKFGALSYQMWRAVRLVVDTGIHYYGWSREQAVQYFRDNTALSDQNINTEVDRYIAWPGQALAYMIGEIHIQQLRIEAKQALGDHFDLKGFHDAVLENGSIPLSVLDKHIHEWITDQQKRYARPSSTPVQ